MNTIEDKMVLPGGYKLEAVVLEDSWRGKNVIEFRIVTDEMTSRERRNSTRVEIMPPFSSRRSYYQREWDPSQEPEYGHIGADSGRMQNPIEALALAEMLTLAADFLRAMHVAGAEKLQQQERLHAERVEAELKEEREREAKRNKLKEELQWYVGQRFKLRRDGYRATVFGTIDRFTDTHVYTTSERGVPMDTRIDDINFFAVMYDGERRYTTIYER